jgi:predicted transcriptional regulator
MTFLDSIRGDRGPDRRRILDMLCDGDAGVGTLVEQLGISQPLVSKHLGVLRDAGPWTSGSTANGASTGWPGSR